MSENDVKAIALFFFYALLDDRRALEAAGEALEMARRRLAANTELKRTVAIVGSTTQI